MKNKRTVLGIILVFVLLIGGASVVYNQLSKNVGTDQLAVQATQPPEEEASEESAEEAAEAPEAVKAPDFTVYDANGGEVRLSEHLGKPIVLNFWASWCGPCQMEMPDFHEKYLELGGEVQFLMINMTDGGRESVDSAEAFIEKNGYTFPVFYDTEGDAAGTYGAYSLPTTYFIDADSNVIAQATGAIDGETLQRGIDMIYTPA